jgi:hypothetical protein
MRFDPAAGTTILAPEAPGRGHWVGAPSVLDDPVRGTVLLTYRVRRPGDRGHRAFVAESADGVDFTDVWSVEKSAFGAASMERFDLVRDPGGRYLLYVSYEHGGDGRWRIDVLESDRPDGFDPAGARTVLTPAAAGTAAVKDPYVVRVGPAYHMFASTFLGDEGPAPTCLAVSLDGVRYRWLGEALSVGEGWDRYQARLTAVVPTGGAFVGLYDGAASAAEDTEERLGLALSFDLRRWERLSVDGPWLASPHATGSLRYADVLVRGGEWWVYYEYARADGSHELRLSRVPAPEA